MRAGRLRDYVLFQSRAVTGEGESRQIVFTDAFTVKVDVVRSTETGARFVTRYRSGIGPGTYRMIWEGVIWNITSAVHDRKHRSLTIDCDFSEAVEVTDTESVQREYIDGLPVVRPESED